MLDVRNIKYHIHRKFTISRRVCALVTVKNLVKKPLMSDLFLPFLNGSEITFGFKDVVAFPTGIRPMFYALLQL